MKSKYRPTIIFSISHSVQTLTLPKAQDWAQGSWPCVHRRNSAEHSSTYQNAAASLTVIPQEGLQEVLPAVAGKLVQVCVCVCVCVLMGSTLRVTKLGFIHILFVGQDSVVGIVTHYGLDGLGIESQ
jgi:hypothetical protein